MVMYVLLDATCHLKYRRLGGLVWTRCISVNRKEISIFILDENTGCKYLERSDGKLFLFHMQYLVPNLIMKFLLHT